jgi:outer membrane protein
MDSKRLIKKTPLILVLLFAITANAQVLTIDEAIKLGLDNNKQLKISAYKVEQAEIKYKQAVDLTLPSLKASAGYTRLSDIEPPQILFPGADKPVALFPVYVNNYMGKVSLNETIFSGFRLRYAMESQKLLEDATRLDAVKDKDEVVFNIANAYISIYKLEQSIKIVDENLNSLDQRITETKKLEAQGVVLHNDELRLELQKSNIQMSRIDLQNNLAIAEYNFNILIGRNEKSDVVIDTTIVANQAVLQPLDTYLDEALKNRSDLQALSTRRRSLENNVKVARTGYYPQLAIAANYYDSRPNPRIIPPQDVFVSTWDAGVVMSWDLMNLYSNKHVIADTRIQLRQSEEVQSQLVDAIKMDVNQSYVTCQQAAQKIELTKVSVQQSEENFRIVNSQYNSSLALTSDLVDANLVMLQAKVSQTLARADALLSYYRLMKSTGSIK